MKIGIMGGTFNPIHNGHLLIAENAYHQYGLDQIVFLPAGIPPHKQHMGILDKDHRCAMIDLAIENIPYFRLDRREVDAAQISYTYLTLTQLKEENPEDEFFFIMGADSLAYFDKWKNPKIILNKATVLAAVRDEFDTGALKQEIKRITDKLGGNIGFITTPEFDVSSQNIRNRVACGQSIRFLVPDKVRDYILYHNLYGTPTESSDKRLER